MLQVRLYLHISMVHLWCFQPRMYLCASEPDYVRVTVSMCAWCSFVYVCMRTRV